VVACDKRFPTKATMDKHIYRFHTTEGQDKYVLGSEDKLAHFLDRQDVKYDRDWSNRIDYSLCSSVLQTTDISVRPDFRLTEISGDAKNPLLVIVCNNEYQHRRYACDLKRTWQIFHALRANQEYQSIPIIFIQFNPHPYKVNGVQYEPKLLIRHNKLLEVYRSLSTTYTNLDPVHPYQIFMYYDMVHRHGEDILSMFHFALGDNKTNADHMKPYVLNTIV
jgi:hypothetical protein